MEEMETITLLDENGIETEFEVLGIVTVEDIDYAVLIPLDDDQAYIFRIDTDENGEEVLSEVEDDEEFNIVKEAWEALYEDDIDYDADTDDEEDFE